MKKLLNTLYVATEGAALRKEGENIVVDIDGAERTRAPLHMLASVVTFGAVLISPPLMQACAARGIVIALLDRNGRFQARVEGPISGNVLLRRQQYRASEAPAQIVKSLLAGKVANQRVVLQRQGC
jgi:CRISP-associated protein Cas1